MQLTLEDLKNRPLNKDMYDSMYETWELGNEHNIECYRSRIREGNDHDIKNECYDMTHNGNDPMENEEMLDHARCFYEDNIFTDEEWVNIFIPAINKQIEENDNFERWYPGYVIKNKETGQLAILGGDYAFCMVEQISQTFTFTKLMTMAILLPVGRGDAIVDGKSWIKSM